MDDKQADAAANAILKDIARVAPKSSAISVEQLANAFSAVVGAEVARRHIEDKG